MSTPEEQYDEGGGEYFDDGDAAGDLLGALIDWLEVNGIQYELTEIVPLFKDEKTKLDLGFVDALKKVETYLEEGGVPIDVFMKDIFFDSYQSVEADELDYTVDEDS